MSAKFVDALKGYEYFMEKRGEASFDEINNFLKGINRGAIAQRTYTHYNSLMRYGFRSYFPINQFDVSRTLGQLPISPDRRQYEREDIKLKAEISSDRNTWTQAKIIDKSIVGFGMETTNRILIKPKDNIWVRMRNYNDIPGILIWRKKYPRRLRFGIRASEYIKNYIISEKKLITTRPTCILVIRKSSKDIITWKELQMIFFKINQFIEAASALLYSVAEVANIHIKLAPPVISSINFASPGSARIKLDVDFAKITKVVIDKFQFWGIDKKHRMEELRGKEIENDGKQLENINLQIQGLRNAVRLRKEAIESGIPKEIAEAIFQATLETLGIDQLTIPTQVYKPGSLEYGIIMKQLLPAGTELLAGDDPEIHVDIDEDSSD